MPSRRLASILAAAVVPVLASCASARPHADAEAGRPAVEGRVAELLRRYAEDDADGVLRLVDPAGFIAYGSDLSEVVRTPAELRRLMADDFALWRSATFGAVRDLDVRVDGALATAYFHVPFSAGGRPPVVVRFSTTWRKSEGRWLLTQIANTVPTVGSSARELIGR